MLAYLEAENAYATAVTKPTEGFQDALYKEMLARIKETDLSVPTKQGKWLYYWRTEQGKQYPIRCRKGEKAGSSEVVLLDLNEIGKTAKFVGLGPMEVSDDGNLLAYGLDTTGFRQYTMQVKDLRTGTVLAEMIPRVDAIAFARDNKTIFYVTEDAQTKRANQFHSHVLGADAAKDPVIYEEKDEKFDLDATRSRSLDYVFVTSSSSTTSEVRFVPANKPTAPLSVVAPREQGHEYYVGHRADQFYIRTNSGGRNFRLVTAPVTDTRRAAWKEIIAHRDDVMLERVDVFADHYVLREREDALPRLRVVDFKTGASSKIDQPEAVYSVEADENPEFSSNAYRYSYESMVTPESLFDYDVTTHARKLRKCDEVLGGYDPVNYDTARVHATAKDGTKIPISLVYKKGTKPDGTHGMVLNAYGAYGISMPADFSSSRVSLLDRGVVFAIAHIRGGGDLGKKWHEQGRMMTKLNTFTDFIDSAEFLLKEGWTTKDRLVITGASAGGLLMGAVTNMRPDLWKAVVSCVPFVDAINTQLDETLPLTAMEFEEWGNPKVREHYDYILQYSPYDNVGAKSYPSMLVKTSYNDSQVMYWEPAKYVAKLRAKKTDRNVLLFKTNMDPAGHGGQSGRYDHLHEVAFDYAFILGQLGMTH